MVVHAQQPRHSRHSHLDHIFFGNPMRRNGTLDAMFFRHPREQGETYVEHFKVASRLSIMSMVGGIFMMVHAFIPGVNLFDVMGTCSESYYGLILDRLHRKQK